MDAAVLAALAHWPDVPDVYGWLALDERGRWRLRGELIGNPVLNEFIGRNYDCDRRGAWYFQNGPQRVFVELACAPWVVRLTGLGTLETHTGRPFDSLARAWLDDRGRLLLSGAMGLGLVHDRDLTALLDRLVDAEGRAADMQTCANLMAGNALPIQLQIAGLSLPVSPVAAASLEALGGFIARPVPDPS